MTLRNCVRCGKLFGAAGDHVLCPDCIKEEHAEFETVRQYLKEHPRAPLLEVSQATGVSVPKLREYVRQGRLAVGEAGEGGLVCERCGRPVSTGRLCERCARGLVMQLRSAASVSNPRAGGSPERQKGRVHLADRFRERE